MTDEILSQSLSAAPAGGPADAPRLDPDLADAARRLAVRGTVLLRNEHDALPLDPAAPVAVLGRVQKDWIAVGYGSGGDVNPPYVTNLLDSLREEGVAVDATLAALTEAWCEANPVDPGTEWGRWPLSFPEMPLDEGLRDAIAAAAARAATAVVVIGRAAGEDRESALEPGSYYLTDDERALLEAAAGAFERTVAVVVTGNVIDLSWAEELGVDALLLAWCGGMEGGRAVARILAGADEPGGRLPDTIARRYEDYPSAGHFGDPQANDYVEDVFVGYRYFETFAPDAVLHPFGFGLGYTTHEITGGAPAAGDDGVSVRARVRNTGGRPGSAVVQLYVSKPDGALSQPARELVAFARTAALEPGAAQTVELDVPWRDLASYDDSGATGHRFAWVLPAGTYTFHLGADVRSARPIGAVEIADTRVLRRLEQAAAPSPDHPFQRMTRRTGPDGESAVEWEPVPVSEVDLRERILSRLPQALPAPAGTADGAAPSFASVLDGTMSLEDFVALLEPGDLAALAYGDIEMDSPLGAPGNAGAFGGVTERLRSLGVPPAITTDGPSGIRLTATASLLPCGTALASTWDPGAVRAMAALHGREMAALGSEVLLSPGMNIHRDPLCGRNFEYFSEDPLLTGSLASAVVTGVQSTGRAACPKHFAANNQETNRIFADSRVSERALREIYLRGFEIVVTTAAPQVIMTSYNKINGVWGHYHYDLVTTIARGEWGYEGLVITDWWMRMAPDPDFPALRDSAYRVRAGVDVLMPGGDAHFSTTRDDAVMDSYRAENGITLGEMQAVALHVLRFLADRARA